jgi:hypothetical protein
MIQGPRKHSASVQSQIEEHTMNLSREASVDAARIEGERALLASIPDADRASIERYPEIAAEVTLNALVGLADGYTGQDLPRLIMRTPRRLGGLNVPGNRGLHDNPDTFYRLIPLDGRSHFLLTGIAPAHPATIFELSALTAQWHTITNLTKTDLRIEPGSHFRILFSPNEPSEADPPADRHVQLTPDAEMLLVRETLADWSLERPGELTIENFVDRGGPRQHDDPQRVEAAAQRVEKWFREAIRLTAGPLQQAPNVFPDPVISGEHGKLVTMAYSIGHFWVRPGQALVLEIDPGEAAYVAAPITNLWGTTNRNLARGASLNSKQATYDADGTFTCVVSLEDPGVHNWLDPDGLERGFLFLRWAGLDPNRVPERLPRLSTRQVAIRDLRASLPGETHWVDASERARIQQQREAEHALRFQEFLDE